MVGDWLVGWLAIGWWLVLFLTFLGIKFFFDSATAPHMPCALYRFFFLIAYYFIYIQPVIRVHVKTCATQVEHKDLGVIQQNSLNFSRAL